MPTSAPQVIDFNEIFNAHIAANQKSWAQDRALTVGASEVFKCLRSVWFLKRGKEFGFEPDDGNEAWGAMERGNLIENYHVVPAMTHHLPPPLKLTLAGSDQNTFVLGKNSATPDGLILGLDPERPLIIKGRGEDIVLEKAGAASVCFEIKSIDPRAILLEERTAHHGQTQVQLGLIRELTEHKPRYSIILYIDASFLDQMTPFVVEYDENAYRSAKIRATQVYTISDPMMITPEGKFNHDCDNCKFKSACGEATLSHFKQLNNAPEDDSAVEEAEPLVQAFFDAKAAKEAAEDAYQQAQERVKELLLDLNTKRIPGKDWSVSWSTVKGKTTLDTEKMRKDGVDLSQYEKVGAGYDRLTISKKAPQKELM